MSSNLHAQICRHFCAQLIAGVRHCGDEPLATPQEIILEYLAQNEQITNRIARDLCFIGSENKMKGILQRMVKNELIELVPGTTRYSAAYRLRRTIR